MEFGRNKGDLTTSSEPFSKSRFSLAYQNSDQSKICYQTKILTGCPLPNFSRIPLENASKTKQTQLLELDEMIKQMPLGPRQWRQI